MRLEMLQWYALFGGAARVAAEHVVGYGISEAGCHVAGAQWGLHVATLQIAVAAVAGSVVIAAEGAACAVFHATDGVDRDAPGPAGRMRFLAQAALSATRSSWSSSCSPQVGRRLCSLSS